MCAQHCLRCLGQPALYGADGGEIRFRTKKHLALLVFLAVEHRASHRRDRLAEVLWPRAAIAEARHSLATALSILRPRLPAEALQTSRDQVSLRTTELAIDLDRLTVRDVLQSDSMVVDLPGFLEGFEIPDAPEFALWKDRQQARLLPQFREILCLLLIHHRRSGDSSHIEQLADRLLAFDELSEEGIRAKMEARAWAGDRLTALKIFEDWRGRLFDELHARPSERLELMASTLRRGGWEKAAINDIPAAPSDKPRERPFIGRATEYSRLYETWEWLKQGKVVHSLVLGDSGVGKTTLVERFTTAVGLEGASVARVQAYDLDRNIPFATLRGLGLSVLDMPGASATPPEALAEVARVIPEVRRRFPSLPAPGQGQGETARIRLTEAVQELFLAVAEEHPLVLIVEDLHLADEASLAVLHLVLRRSTGEPILTVFTGRPGELGHSTQATLLRENLIRLGSQELALLPLDSSESAELLSGLLRHVALKPTATVRRSLIAASGGFPMVLELLVHDWRTHGVQSIAIALEGMTAEFVVGDDPRPAYGHLVSRLADSLEPVTRSTLALAAVLGRRLNDLSMYTLIDLSLSQTMTALGQLLDTRILRDSEPGLEFTNELVRAHVYSSIPSPIRKALHASVSNRLKNLEDVQEPLTGLEIAWHTIRAGRIQEAIPLLIQGAKTAMRSGAPHSAEAALSSALGSIEPGTASVVELRVLLAQSLQEQGRWRDSLSVLDTLHGTECNGRTQEVFALSALARGYLGLAASRELLDALPILEETIRSSSHLPSRVRAARAVAHGLSVLRDRSLGQRLLPLVDSIPIDELDVDTRGQFTLARAMFLYQAGEIEASYQEAERGLKALKAIGAANAVALHLQAGLGVTLSLQGHYHESVRHFETCRALAARLGNDAIAASILANLAIVYLRVGRSDGPAWCARQVRQLGLSGYADWNDVTLTYAEGMSYALSNQPGKAREAISHLESRFPPSIPEVLLQRWLLWKADVLLVAGSRVDAFETATRAVGGYNLELGSLGFAGAFARWTALTCLATSLESAGKETIGRLENRLGDFDALDQLEILCAASQIGLRSPDSYVDLILDKAQRLPQPTVDLVRNLGMRSCI